MKFGLPFPKSPVLFPITTVSATARRSKCVNKFLQIKKIFIDEPSGLKWTSARFVLTIFLYFVGVLKRKATGIFEKIVPESEKMPSADEKMVTSDEKILTSGEKMVTSDEKMVSSSEKMVTFVEKALISEERCFRKRF